tara:strand:+ start:87813 stop:88844 length:1032 start_codon:yes stop_codon:yes gene_type:complete
MLRRLFTFAAISLAIATVSYAATASTPETSAGAAAAPADPSLVLGNQACVKCHASEIKTWQATPHARTFDELHRQPEAKQIAAKLGLNSIKHEGRCVNCHYTSQTDAASGKHHVIAGVSCESCHGAAKHWLDEHHDYGGESITRLTETPEHRAQRIAKSVAAGMRNPTNVFLVAQSCLRCHTTADEQLVNVGGHSAGSLEFEFVSWSQGTIRHNFVRSDGKSNEVSSPERLRVMFVAGMIAELESSMRATAVATEKATYGVTVAKRAARAGKRIKSVAAKVSDARLSEIIKVFDSVKLKLNNSAELTRAADEIAALGYQFAEQADGSQFTALDGFVPQSDRWK